jgi:hypothetical protein
MDGFTQNSDQVERDSVSLAFDETIEPGTRNGEEAKRPQL